MASRAAADRQAHLRTADDQILAAEPADRDHLQFEVVVHSPFGEARAYLPVSDEDPIYGIYHRHRDEEPERILEELRLRTPVVSAVALTRTHYTTLYRRQRLQINGFLEPWKPFYEIRMPGAVSPGTALIPVPEEDDEIYDMMAAALRRVADDRYRVPLRHISGAPAARYPHAGEAPPVVCRPLR